MKKLHAKSLAFVTAVTLTGGTVFASCEALLHDSIIEGTELYLLQLVATENFFIDFIPAEDAAG